MNEMEMKMNSAMAVPGTGRNSGKRIDRKLWKRFIFNISLVVVLLVLGVFIGIMIRNNQLINEEILSKAKSFFSNILLTRRWNANYGGVYVEKKNGMTSNPYLENPDIHTVDGKVYTMKNPALMTREISEYAENEGLFRFHITSLKPLNPGNKPDPFETEALQLFEQGKKEHTGNMRKNGKHFFRYMAPLMVERSCLQCHGKQGYKVGDVRGGISVTVDVTNVHSTLKWQNRIIIILSILTAMVVLGVIYFFIMKLNTRLTEAYMQIEIMAMHDELTGLYNRRYFFERLKEEFHRAKRYRYHLACILLDLDHFKKVNDTYGHPAGDTVLARIAAVVKDNCRQSDVVARYGGEEFVIMLPDSTKKNSILAAKKIRQIVAEQTIELEDGQQINITASLGVTVVAPEELQEVDDYHFIISQADKALYKAKTKGRNRVEAL
jgi:diguanylate cyclase (GGDEF)-like protein